MLIFRLHPCLEQVQPFGDVELDLCGEPGGRSAVTDADACERLSRRYGASGASEAPPPSSSNVC